MPPVPPIGEGFFTGDEPSRAGAGFTEHTDYTEGFEQEGPERTGNGRRTADNGGQKIGREEAKKAQKTESECVTEVTERGHRGGGSVPREAEGFLHSNLGLTD